MKQLTRIVTTGDSATSRRMRQALERYKAMTPEQRDQADAAETESRRLMVREGTRLTAIARCGLEGAMFDRKLDTLATDSESQRQAVRTARAFVNHFPELKKGLALWGEPGRRKSSIMAGIVHAVLTEKTRVYNVLYLPCHEIDEIERTMDLGVAVANADLVVLDDIEKAMDEPGARYQSRTDKLVRSIINRVDRVKRPIVCVTSNKGPDEQKKLGTAWASRLVGLCHWQEVSGGDLRERDEDSVWWAQ